MKRWLAAIAVAALTLGCGGATTATEQPTGEQSAEVSPNVTTYIGLPQGLKRINANCAHKVPSGSSVHKTGSTYFYSGGATSGSFGACTSTPQTATAAQARLVSQWNAPGDLDSVLDYMEGYVTIPPPPNTKEGQLINFFFGGQSFGGQSFISRVGIVILWGGSSIFGTNKWFASFWSWHNDGTIVIGPDAPPELHEGDEVYGSMSDDTATNNWTLFMNINRPDGSSASFVMQDVQNAYLFDKMPGIIYDSGVVRCSDYPPRNHTGQHVPGQFALRSLYVETTDLTTTPWTVRQFTGPYTFESNNYPCHFKASTDQWGSPTAAQMWNWWE